MIKVMCSWIWVQDPILQQQAFHILLEAIRFLPDQITQVWTQRLKGRCSSKTVKGTNQSQRPSVPTHIRQQWLMAQWSMHNSLLEETYHDKTRKSHPWPASSKWLRRACCMALQPQLRHKAFQWKNGEGEVAWLTGLKKSAQQKSFTNTATLLVLQHCTISRSPSSSCCKGITQSRAPLVMIVICRIT